MFNRQSNAGMAGAVNGGVICIEFGYIQLCYSVGRSLVALNALFYEF